MDNYDPPSRQYLKVINLLDVVPAVPMLRARARRSPSSPSSTTVRSRCPCAST